MRSESTLRINRLRQSEPGPGWVSGTVLLETLAALALLVGAAAVITAALNSSIQSVDRLRAKTHAADLAITLMSEIQLGIKPSVTTSPQRFDPPFEDWTWEVASGGDEGEIAHSKRFELIEVVVRREDPAITHRLGQVIVVPGVSSITSERSAVEPGIFNP